MVELAPSAPGHRPPPHPEGDPLVELRGLTTGYERTPVLQGLAARGVILRRNALRLARPPSGLGPFDLALLDPPYREEGWPLLLARLAHFGWLAPQAWCAVETARVSAAPPELADFTCNDMRDDGRVRLVFYRLRGGA